MSVKIGACSLNNDPLDFKRNCERVIESIRQCKAMGCMMRVGGEMEIPGYGCGDHFMEYDTTQHSWECIRDILKSGVTEDIVCDVGCPVLHRAALYNARVIMFKSKVVAIRTKMALADGGNYFQTRYFTAWKHPRAMAQFLLPTCIQQLTGQTTVPIGALILDFLDTSVAWEICEESWISNNPMIDAALDGAEIFINTSASEIERGKLHRKLQMVEEFTQRHGGAYLYVNIKGVSGERNLYDGCCFFSQNGRIKELSEPFTLEEISVTPMMIKLDALRVFRLANKSFQKDSHGIPLIPRVSVPVTLGNCLEEYLYDGPKHKLQLERRRVDYECPHATLEPSYFLWEILRKTRARGFFLPLSGGVDSSCVALIVFNMCHMLVNQIQKGSALLLKQLKEVLREPQFQIGSPQQLCGKILFTCYMATNNSSEGTRIKAELLAKSIGSLHRSLTFDGLFQQFKTLGERECGLQLKYQKEGGSWRSDIALQNVQARTRMVLAYFLALLQLQRTRLQGFLLVLGSSNLDESLRGYFTKYDCSSADYNPIGSFSKANVKQLLNWAAQRHGFEFVEDIMHAPPTAQLRPLKSGEVAQTDEEDMQLTYDELNLFGRLRKIERLGPVSMFDRLYGMIDHEEAGVIAEKIKKFFRYYAVNRHKCTTLPPSLHYDPEGCDDNRFDMRPVFYATDWTYQFSLLDTRVKDMPSRS